MPQKHKYQKLSIVIPAHNEAENIAELIGRVRAVKWPLLTEIIVIDDGSTDGTAAEVSRLTGKDLKLVTNESNLGKTQTVKRGIQMTTGDLVVVQDADLEYNPQELLGFIKLFTSSDTQVVYGNRFGKQNPVIYWQNWIGNRFLSLISSLFTYPRARMWTNDMEVCYKMIQGDMAREIASELTSTSSFGLEPEVTARLARRKPTFAEIPISYNPRTHAQGKHISATKDGLLAIWQIVKFNLFS